MAAAAHLQERVAQLIYHAPTVVELRIAFNVQALLRGRRGRYVDSQQLEHVAALKPPRRGRNDTWTWCREVKADEAVLIAATSEGA